MKKKELSSSSASSSFFSLIFRNCFMFPWIISLAREIGYGEIFARKSCNSLVTEGNFFLGKFLEKSQKWLKLKKLIKEKNYYSTLNPHSKGGFCPSFELMTPTLRQSYIKVRIPWQLNDQTTFPVRKFFTGGDRTQLQPIFLFYVWCPKPRSFSETIRFQHVRNFLGCWFFFSLFLTVYFLPSFPLIET